MTTPVKQQFRGRFELKVDPKGRLSLPSSYRPGTVLGSSLQTESSTAGKKTELIITNSRFRSRSCLHVYTANEWEKLERKISRLSALKTEVQAFNRFYLSGGQAVEVDSQSRILIPQSLRRFAGIDSHVVAVGLGDKFEIWAQDKWDAIYSELTETFEETLNAVADMDDVSSSSGGDS